MDLKHWITTCAGGVVVLAALGACSGEPSAAPAPDPANSSSSSPQQALTASPSSEAEPSQPAAAMGEIRSVGLGADARRVTQLFVDFALGIADTPPADTPIDLFLGQRPVATVESDDSRDAWTICPDSGAYAGGCPFSPLDVIAEASALRATPFSPDLVCARSERAPDALRGYDHVAITPVPQGACAAGQWVVDLYVNDVGQVVAVNLTHGEP